MPPAAKSKEKPTSLSAHLFKQYPGQAVHAALLPWWLTDASVWLLAMLTCTPRGFRGVRPVASVLYAPYGAAAPAAGGGGPC